MEPFEHLVLQHERKIYFYIYRMVGGNRHDAEDLTQETFLRAYRHISSIDPSQNVTAWLFTIATHLVYDRSRSAQKRHEIVMDTSQLDDETIALVASYNSIEAENDRRDLESALQKIKPQYRSVLLLYYKEGFAYHEIATMLSLPINTVKTHIVRAKKELQKLY